MMHNMFGCLPFRRTSGKKIHAEKAGVIETVYRVELSKNQSPRKSPAVKKTVRFADSAPTILGENIEEEDCEKRNSEERCGIRVKVKMTKEEAIRFLSKCKEGGFLDVKDVASELNLCQIPYKQSQAP